jgi:hypothetical protein
MNNTLGRFRVQINDNALHVSVITLQILTGVKHESSRRRRKLQPLNRGHFGHACADCGPPIRIRASEKRASPRGRLPARKILSRKRCEMREPLRNSPTPPERRHAPVNLLAITLIFNRLEPLPTQLKLSHEVDNGHDGIDYRRLSTAEIEQLEKQEQYADEWFQRRFEFARKAREGAK